MKLKRRLSCMLSVVMLFSLFAGCIPAYAEEVPVQEAGICIHHPEHDQTCGYAPAQEGQPCTHQHDESCGYQEATPEIPCDKGCTDTDGDGVIDHAQDCAYTPAVEGAPCTHQHDESCGYQEAVEGTACEYALNGCPYCVVSWEWVDPEGLLAQDNGVWGMGLPGVSQDNPLTREALAQMLPAQITATPQNGEAVALDLVWDLTSIPEVGATSGDYTVTASLAETQENYALTQDAAPLAVTLQLGGGESYAVSDQVLSQHIISAPEKILGTTIDMFDYYLTGEDASDNSNPENFWDKGINNGHALLFGAGMEKNSGTNGWPNYTQPGEGTKDYPANLIGGTGVDTQGQGGSNFHNDGSWNAWSNRGGGPTVGIVSNTLGQDGYPYLSLEDDYWNWTYATKLTGRSETESLNYLFDPAVEHEGKVSYPDVGGLLRVDKNGYYYYDCNETFASLADSDDKKNIVLYDAPAVRAAGLSKNGQFFPFNEAAPLFDSSYWNDMTMDTDIRSDNSIINHYFGVHMSTRFIQQNGGYIEPAGTPNRTPVTYEFSGDDDVWIFIDGVLVADLGGIHDATKVSIDFSTGAITISSESTNSSMYYGPVFRAYTSTLKAAFEAAGKTNMAWDGNTFPDNTYHTLDFFYLERGNTDSNMKLKYNLVTIPESDLIKVDQLGNAVPGVTFALYDADDVTNPIATGTTDSSGEFIFLQEKNGTQYPLTIDELYRIAGENLTGDNDLILREVSTPDGYRPVGDIGLRFEESANGERLLVSNDVWTEGAYAMAKVTATTPNTIDLLETATGTAVKRSVTIGGQNPADPNPVMFAVVFQKQEKKNPSDPDVWLPISGDPIGGWHVQPDSTWNSILTAAQANPYVFQLASSGAYQVEVSNLPGDIMSYYYVAADDNKANAEYTIAYYYTTADTLAEATAQNTWRIESDTKDAVSRVFSMDVYVSNIKNYLLVQKVDDADTKVDGAVFDLYKEDQVTVADDGTVTVKDNQTPYDTVTTATRTVTLNPDTNASIRLEGGAVFPGEQNKPLVTGENYYLVERSVPHGYINETEPIHIKVTDQGVYADAGTADDNVKVLLGPGSLMRSMVQFAADDSVDVTLHDITASLKTNATYEGLGSAEASESKTLVFRNGGNTLDYGPADPKETATFTVESGWSDLVIRQAASTAENGGNWTDLNGQDITKLFSGTVTVQVSNDRTGDLKISKTVDAPNGATPSDDQFTFTVTVAGAGDGTYTVSGNATAPTGPTITFDNDVATVTLKKDQSLTIKGLPYNAEYTVAETPVSGYSTSVTVSGDGTSANNTTHANTTSIEGKIPHTTDNTNPVELAYTNTYDGTVKVTLQGTKTVAGRAIAADETFTFQLALASGTPANVVMPSPATATVTGNGTDDTASFQFGQITFKDEGVYTFNITETPGSNTGLVYDSHTATATVSVTKDQSSGVLTVSSITYSNTGAPVSSDASTTDKAAFTNQWKSLTLEKQVTGTMGDRDKAFQFTIAIEGTAGKTYNYLGGALNSSTAETPADGTLTFDNHDQATVSLKHGQNITILGLPADSEYTIAETNAQSDGYTAKINGTVDSDFTTTDTLSDDATTKVTFLNSKGGSVPTGIRTEQMPWILALEAVLMGGTVWYLIHTIRRRAKNRSHNG